MFVVAIVLCSIAYFLWFRLRNKGAWSNFVTVMKCTKIGLMNLELWDKMMMICKVVQENGGVCSCYLYERGIRGMYFITDPVDSMTALKACSEKDYVYDYWKPWMGEASFSGNAQINKVFRKFYPKSFMPTNMEVFSKYFNVHSKKFVKKLMSNVVGKGPVDMTRHLRLYNIKLLCDTMVVLEDPEKVNLEEYIDAVPKFLNTVAYRIERIWMHQDFLFKWTDLKKEQDAALKVLRNTADEVIRQRRQKLKAIREKKCDPPGHEVIIDTLLEAADEGIISKEMMEGEVNGILFAGHDTSSYTLLYVLVLLGSYPEVQERAFEEIQNILGDRTVVTKDDLAKMVYIEAIIKEGMRINPYVGILPRRLSHDVALKKATLAAGCTVIVSVWAVHRNECWGPDAEVYRPERWLEPDKLPKPTVMLGFAEGARNCTGRRYAMQSMKTLLAHLIPAFRFKADHTKMKFKFNGVLEPISGHEISIERRD